MSLSQTLLAIILLNCIIAWILFIFFGQKTVRRLRKNPETQDYLGAVFFSGQDILNVAQALSLPKKIAKKFDSNGTSLSANSELVRKHTSRFEQIFAKIFYWHFVISFSSMVIASFVFS